MAVVFISPKQKQKKFIFGIAAGLVAFIALLSLRIFVFPARVDVAPGVVFNKAKVTVDLSVLDSDRFKSLEAFSQIEVQYKYKAFTEDKKEVGGMIAASSEDAARKILEGMGFNGITIEEAGIGRDNPFIPYYQMQIQAEEEQPAIKKKAPPAVKATTKKQ